MTLKTRGQSCDSFGQRTQSSSQPQQRQNATWDNNSRRSNTASNSVAASMLRANNRSNNNTNNSNQVILGAQMHNFPARGSRSTTIGTPLGRPESSTTAHRINRIDGAVRRNRSRIYDDPAVVEGYNSVPLIEMDRLPRGGITMETAAVGRIQFGIPPETIKDSMRLGFEVPSVYIVPVERFCREMGPALGINLAEFEFPAYFNYFCSNKRCTLVVDSFDAEQNIRTVFGETLFGPEQFRNHANPIPNEDEDFGPNFCKEARPNFYKEFTYFRTEDDQRERTIDHLLEFCHFQGSQKRFGATGLNHEKLGVPPIVKGENNEEQMEGNFSFAVPEDSTVDIAMEEENGDEMPGLRRTLSDPDIRSASIDNMVPAVPPSTGNNDSFPFSTENSNSTKRFPRRGSMDSTGSFLSRGGRSSRDGMSWASGASFMLASDDEEDPSKHSWMYSQAKWLGEVATVFPPEATEYEKQLKSCARVEIFKMAGGTEYIVHDVDRNNIIIGKARLSGTVRVPDEMAVEGFLARDPEEDFKSDTEDEEFEEDSDDDGDRESHNLASKSQDVGRKSPPTFHPPSFGVTVLGNSHGFDKNGSVSGYVLWINGRGVMIDPPPYSSASLEREGIRPTMIMAIIITHCHADHDAGSFQKVMTGSRVAIITTPTIYKSFIRKYAALSGLSPTLLKHSHRHRPAIIGQPLKFQGATFHFTYTLHTIPCIAFKVEWRGRSMVFTSDHLNKPTEIYNLEQMGVVTPERANDLRRLPLQECDVLLHEAGEPPIHTPISVLQEMPEEIKKRLYVVHTSSLDGANDLRVAPTGTAGTIRLDELRVPRPAIIDSTMDGNSTDETIQKDHDVNRSTLSEWIDDEYDNAPSDDRSKILARRLSTCSDENQVEASKTTPKVFLRRTCVSDAWFILNLLSNVPFLSSLNYSNTMEVLEIAQVEIFSPNKVVIPADRREKILCVVWEGTCVERDAIGESSIDANLSVKYQQPIPIDVDLKQVVDLYHHDSALGRTNPTVWHAGDWTGPLALQPDMERSAEKKGNDGPKDVVALSTEGVKVIMLNMKDLQKILKSGSKLFRKYLLLKEKQKAEEDAFRAQIIRDEADHDEVDPYFRQSENGIIDVESVVDQTPNNWYAYDSVLEVLKCNSALRVLTAHQKRHLESLAEGPRYFESNKYLWQVGQPVDYAFLIVAGTANFAQKPEDEVFRNRRGSTGNMGPLPIQPTQQTNRPRLDVPFIEQDKQLFNVPPNSEYARLEIGLQLRVEEMELDVYEQPKDILPKEERVRNTRDRFANKVLARLYSRRAYTDGLVFSRGNLLSDTSRMVSGNLANIHHTGRQESMSSITHGLAARDHHCHTSNMVAGPEGGCVVMIFPRSTLVSFLDSNPGVLLSLLGTQVVV